MDRFDIHRATSANKAAWEASAPPHVNRDAEYAVYKNRKATIPLSHTLIAI